MMLPLRLRHSEGLDGKPEAWFLPGGDTGQWFDTLVEWGLAREDTRVFLIPRSVDDRACAGMLVVPAEAHSFSRPAAGLGCRRVAGAMFVPVDAVLEPPVTDAEVRKLSALPVSFYHPVYGLSGFMQAAGSRLSDLLQAPVQTAENWNSARVGAPVLPELSSIIILRTASPEDLFGEAPKEIGSEPLSDLPPVADEPKEDRLSTVGREIGRFLLQRLSKALEQLPQSKQRRRAAAGGVGGWAKRKLFNLEQRLEHLRNKELHRLASLFETDPEAALRHAIPVSQFVHRGLAPPGFRLAPHSLDFDPRHLGGGPADFWQVPRNLLEVLRERYREMANRELQLGRHRRAAYVYAVLLADLVSAAGALKKGRLFREAAVLYEEELNNLAEAAACLEQGGFLSEALERYEKLGNWLKVADLHERLGNVPAAQAALRRVVRARTAQPDILGAADLLEKRLNAPDEALALLLGAWPASYQAANCLTAAFQLMARLGRHEAALDTLRGLGGSVQADHVQPFLTVLDGFARTYPHDGVRHLAADLSRTLIAAQLNRPGITEQTAGRLLEFLVRLAPQDRLLPRDTLRYLDQLRATDLRASQARPAPRPGAKPVVDRRFELPRQMQWRELRREWHWFYALGVTPKRLTLVRGVWDGAYQSLSWACDASAAKAFILEPTAEQGDAVALAAAGEPALAQKTFPAGYQFYDKPCAAGTPSWLPNQDFPFAFGEDAAWAMHVANGRAVLSCYDKTRGLLLHTIDLTQELLQEGERTEKTRLCIAALRTGAAVALGNRLVVAGGGNRLIQVELPGQAVRLLPTIPSTRQGVAVMLEHGAVMHWVGSSEWMELDYDFGSPLAAFVPGGPLVLISGMRGLLLDVDSQGVKHVTRFELTGQRAVGVTATSYPGEFGVLGERGEMTVYRVPR